MRPMRASPHRLQLLPQSALSQVSVHSQGSVARREGQGTAPRAVLSRRVYHPRTACATGITEPAGLLQFVVPGSVRDAAANRCRSPASGSEDRLSGCAAHLEPEPATSSPCPLCRAGRWIACRPKFFLPVRVLSRLFRGKLLAL